MNKTTSYVLMLLAFVLVIACGKKDSETAKEVWPEMDEFHMVMADSFHPFKDSANLEPAKIYAGEMAKVAEKWANAPLPDKVDNDEVKANLAQLKTDAVAFTQIVQSGDSTKIAESLTSMHDLFHKLQEAWYGGGEGHGHQH
jgi:hypothetical protein